MVSIEKARYFVYDKGYYGKNNYLIIYFVEGILKNYISHFYVIKMMMEVGLMELNMM